VTDSAQKQKSLEEAFKPGTELRYIRPSRHSGGRIGSDLHEDGARNREKPHAGTTTMIKLVRFGSISGTFRFRENLVDGLQFCNPAIRKF